jgi:AcrR family transcriptional regulator
LSSEARRRDLVRVAGELMQRRGIHGVQLGAVATAGGVTRQLVHRLFPGRQALIIAVLEDFADDLSQRFGQGAARSLPSSLEDATRVFVDAVCDTIEAKGVGPWELLEGKGPDAAVAGRSRAVLDRVVAPWCVHIAARTGLAARDARMLAHMIVATGRVVLERWYRGELARARAVEYATRGVSALLTAFTVHAGRGRSALAGGRPIK